MNPYAGLPMCAVCNDFRFITDSVAAREGNVSPCPKCGAETEDIGGKTRETKVSRERYAHFRETRWLEMQKGIGISQIDLTDDELVIYRRMQKEHPGTSNKTILTWIEGQRYDPSKDEEFLAEARQKFKIWRAR